MRPRPILWPENEKHTTCIFIFSAGRAETLSAEEFAQLEDGAPISVQYGEGHDNAGWRFGRLNKAQLAQ
jgi:hypothetical protein